jgi:hypothetical protein
MEGRKEEKNREPVAIEETVRGCCACEGKDADDPINGIDAQNAALHEVEHGVEAGLGTVFEDDERKNETADDEEEIDAKASKIGESARVR